MNKNNIIREPKHFSQIFMKFASEFREHLEFFSRYYGYNDANNMLKSTTRYRVDHRKRVKDDKPYLSSLKSVSCPRCR